ncbi:MAG: OmpA family protein [Myxococcales bacterium]|nr:OmpA family protein [Myxococcales bacterium]
MKRPLDLGEDEARDRWVVSYADFITLLFAFFVVLYAISTVDTRKFERVSVGMKEAFVEGPRGAQPILLDLLLPGGAGGLAPEAEDHREPTASDAASLAPQWAAVQDALNGSLGAVLEPEEQDEVVRMQGTPRGFMISLSAGHLFEPGSAELRDGAEKVLGGIGAVLESVAMPVRLEGHTDDAPIRSRRYPSNWELSTARATRVLRFLLERHALRPDRLSAAGYAQYRPLYPNESPSERARNRRVDVLLIADPLAGYEPPGPDAQLGNLLEQLPPLHEETDAGRDG